jgi:flagellar basal-body rod protein FlgC
MFRSLAIAASGLSAQRQRMETVASNIANAETTRGPDGKPYQRRVTVLEPGDASARDPALAPGQPVGSGGPFHGVAAFEVPSGNFPADGPKGFKVPVLETRDGASGVRIADVREDTTEGPLVYDPGHPDANEQGYVRYPNVRLTDEMIDMMDARRVYEANATVFQSAKAMLRRALDI